MRPKDGTGTACPGLDVTTNRCTVYKKRLTTYICVKVEPDTVDQMHKDGLLPDSCGYVRWSQGKAPLEEPPVSVLTPFALAPLSFRRQYERANKKWQRER